MTKTSANKNNKKENKDPKRTTLSQELRLRKRVCVTLESALREALERPPNTGSANPYPVTLAAAIEHLLARHSLLPN